MKRFKAHLKRNALVPYVAEVIVEMPDDVPDAHVQRFIRNEVEITVMEGRANFEPILSDAEFGGDEIVEHVEPLRSIPTGARRIRATFTPQHWVRDTAVETDPEGECSWDATSDVYDRFPHFKDGDTLPRPRDCDVLARCDSAPKWIREWSGPFEVDLEYED